MTGNLKYQRLKRLYTTFQGSCLGQGSKNPLGLTDSHPWTSPRSRSTEESSQPGLCSSAPRDEFYSRQTLILHVKTQLHRTENHHAQSTWSSLSDGLAASTDSVKSRHLSLLTHKHSSYNHCISYPYKHTAVHCINKSVAFVNYKPKAFLVFFLHWFVCIILRYITLFKFIKSPSHL